MAQSIAVIQMDAPERLNPATDSTLVLALEAQRRGYALYSYLPSDLYRDEEGKILCSARPARFHDRAENWLEAGALETLDLARADVILMRQDPPFNMAYVSACHLLESLKGKTRVVNDPYWVRNLPEKLFPLAFSRYMPPTLIASAPEPVRDFLRRHGDIVLKPLYGHGGRGVFRLRQGDSNLEALLELLWRDAAEPVVAQKFLPEVRDGDRRVILMDGKVEAAFARLPAAGEIRANTRVGGAPARAELNPRQKEICEAVGSVLRERGLLFAGLDLIGDWLTEINITSPTGLRFVHALYGTRPEVAFWDAAEGAAPQGG